MTLTETILSTIVVASATGIVTATRHQSKYRVGEVYKHYLGELRIPRLQLLLGAVFWIALLSLIAAAVSTADARPPYATTKLGTTPAEVHAKFPGLIEANFTTARSTRIFLALSNQELIDLHAMYKLARGNTAFLDSRVAAYGGTATQARWAKVKAGTLPGTPISHVGGSNKSIGYLESTPVHLDYTIKEIYLDYRTAPLGALSRSAALFQTLNFLGSRLVIAYGAGYTVGTGVAFILDRYAPGTYDAIGGTVAIIIERIDDSHTIDEQEKATYDLAQLFNYSTGSTSSNAGDYLGAGSYTAYYNYYSWYSGGEVAYSRLRGVVTTEPCKEEDKDCGGR